MLQAPTSSEALAHWRYAPDEWRDFVSYEAEQYEKRLKSARYFIIIVILIAVPVVTLLLWVPLWLGNRWGGDVWGPAFAVTVVA